MNLTIVNLFDVLYYLIKVYINYFVIMNALYSKLFKIELKTDILL